jgi:DNA polymerase-3 subunit alpha
VAIADTDITDYVALMRARGDLQTSYDMDSLETINLVKVDILGLNTLSVLREIEESVGANFDPAIIEDREIYRRFCEAETNGIFQFESEGAKEVLRRVQPANIQELIACTGLNRPAPIKLGILDEYIEGKHGHADKSNPWYKFTKDTYGTIVYQEHVMQICRELAGMGWDDVDQVMKNLSVGHSYNSEPEKKFVAGAKKVGLLSQEQARDLYQKMTAYLFNKGHGAGYTLISAYMMWLKIRYPLEFYYALLKNERVDMKRENYKAEAVKNGVLIFLPHVNGGASYEIAEFEGEKVIREGLTTIKFVGQKSAELIKAHAPYANRAEFIAKCNVNSRVMSVLDEAGALEFDQEKYMRRVERYCSSLYARSLSMG